MKRTEIKKIMSKIPTVELREIEYSWIELILERQCHSRKETYKKLGISKYKLWDAINKGKITVGEECGNGG